MPSGLIYQHRYNNEDLTKSKVYKLVSNKTDKIYVGTTTLPLSTRLSIHKSTAMKNIKACSSKILFQDNAEVKIELLIEFDCQTRAQLRVLEEAYRFQYGNLCVNKNRAFTTPEEKKEYTILWQIRNQDKYRRQKAQYYQLHKDFIKQRARAYYYNKKNQNIQVDV